jgi:hypothetical protein
MPETSLSWVKNNNIRAITGNPDFIQTTENYLHNYNVGFSTNLKTYLTLICRIPFL